MYNVTTRARTYKQPRLGYINPNTFQEYEIYKYADLYETENIHASLVGLAVDYLTRYLITNNKEKSFKISLMGAKKIGEEKKAFKLLKNINGIDNESIKSACKLVGYDCIFRSGTSAYKPVESINPDEKTIFNILVMIKRSEEFIHEYGPILIDGFGFLGGYTRTVISGDADFLTEDTIWDFKVSKNKIKAAHTLQLYMYYLMGCRTIYLNKEFNFKNNIKKLGFFNPRLSKVYIKNISEIDEEIKKEVENDVIGYKKGEIDPYLIFLKNKIEE